MKKIGFTIGKFAPLHKGHQYLIETLLNEMDEAYVIVYETDVIDIPIEKRAGWINKLYPNVKVILAKNPPKQYGLDEQSVKIQTDYLKEVLGDIQVTHFFSSEKYGKFVAGELNVENRMVDFNRDYVPICASKIRAHLDDCAEFLNEVVLSDLKNLK